MTSQLDSMSKVKKIACNKFLFEDISSAEVLTKEDINSWLEVVASDTPDINEKSILEGVVTKIDEHAGYVFVFVHGLKGEGKIALKEFVDYDNNPVEVHLNDTIKVFLESIESKGGIVLSREKVLMMEAWEYIKEHYKENKQVEGHIAGIMPAGCIVNIRGINVFLPNSHVDTKPVDASTLLNKKMSFYVMNINQERGGNISVSRKKVIEESYKEDRAKFFQSIKEGDVVEGEVKSLTNYGVFVKLFETDEFGVVDGLLHITDISWSRVNHPSILYNVGDKIKVKLIKIDMEKLRISLGVKQLIDNPWSNIKKEYIVGNIYTGKIVSIESYGIFVSLDKGIEGLVHNTEIDWVNNIQPFKTADNIGKEVKVKILMIDTESNRISLSIKQAQDNPFSIFAQHNPEGSIVWCYVSNIANFGIFVKFDKEIVEQEIEALIHLTDLVWKKNPEQKLKKYKIGDKIQARVLRINMQKGKINLGIKQLDYDSFEEFLKIVTVNEILDCKINNIDANGIYVKPIKHDVEVFIESKDIKDISNLSNYQTIKCKVMEIGNYKIKLKPVNSTDKASKE